MRLTILILRPAPAVFVARSLEYDIAAQGDPLQDALVQGMERMAKLVSGCSSKSRYGSERDAKRCAAKCLEQRNVKLRAYACHECGGWHLTRNQAG